MNLVEVRDRSEWLIEQLTMVWKDAVQATHLFLSDASIADIQRCVPTAIATVSHLIVVENSGETPVAFMGINDQKLEMLFVSSERCGQGLGRKLVDYGIETYAVNQLTVNEQNPQAKGFYERMGFKVYKSTETDEQGRPFPLLYMKRLQRF